MPHVVKLAELPTSGGATLFEGGAYDAEVSFFLVDSAPGEGPDEHSHPYPEVFVIRHGQARFVIDGEGLDAQGGDIVVAPANVPHGFVNAGPGRLEMINLHPSGAMITRWLSENR